MNMKGFASALTAALLMVACGGSGQAPHDISPEAAVGTTRVTFRAGSGETASAETQFEDLLPEAVRLWLYRWAFDRGHLDTILDRWLVQPLLDVSRLLARLDKVGSSRYRTRSARAAVSVTGAAQQRGD